MMATQTHDGFWAIVLQIAHGNLPKPLLGASENGPFVVASANHMSAASELLICAENNIPGASIFQRCIGKKQASIANFLQARSGPKMEWHPDILRLLIHYGRFSAVVALLRDLLSRLQVNSCFFVQRALLAVYLWQHSTRSYY